VILINLLPYREEKRKRRKNAFFAGLVLAALVGALEHEAGAGVSVSRVVGE